MQFYTVASVDTVVTRVVQVLAEGLQAGNKVLWLVSGGSVVPIAVAALRQLNQQAVAIGQLTIMLADERFGPVGHAESNWRQLEVAGFAAGEARCIPTLQGKDAESTRLDYTSALANALDTTTLHIGLFGIGADGHTAGILPHSPAANEDAPLITAYQADDYLRLTVSASLFPRLDVAIAYAAGEQKEPALQALQQAAATPREQPALLLARATRTDIYNDRIGEEI